MTASPNPERSPTTGPDRPAQTAPGIPPAVPPAAAPPAPPSVHIRALLTWIAIFPLVTLGLLALGPVSEHWHLVLRTLVLTAIVVPISVYLVMPLLLRAYGSLRRRAAR